MKQRMIHLLLLCILVLGNSVTASAQPSSNDCGCDTSLKQLTHQDYDLLVEYALLGEDYDSLKLRLELLVDDAEAELAICDLQQDELEAIIEDLRKYISKLEKEVARNRRKLRVMKVFAYAGVGASAVLTLILILTK